MKIINITLHKSGTQEIATLEGEHGLEYKLVKDLPKEMAEEYYKDNKNK